MRQYYLPVESDTSQNRDPTRPADITGYDVWEPVDKLMVEVSKANEDINIVDIFRCWAPSDSSDVIKIYRNTGGWNDKDKKGRCRCVELAFLSFAG